MISRLFAVVLTVACGTLFPALSTADQKLENVTIGTGFPLDMFFLVGNSLCRQIEKPRSPGASDNQRTGSTTSTAAPEDLLARAWVDCVRLCRYTETCCI